MDKTETRVIKAFVKKVKTVYPDSQIILFGSRATGKSTKESDYDLLVISRAFGPMPFDKRAPSVYHLKRDIPAPMDIICATPQETKRKKMSVISEAIREGIDVSAMA